MIDLETGLVLGPLFGNGVTFDQDPGMYYASRPGLYADQNSLTILGEIQVFPTLHSNQVVMGLWDLSHLDGDANYVTKDSHFSVQWGIQVRQVNGKWFLLGGINDLDTPCGEQPGPKVDPMDSIVGGGANHDLSTRAKFACVWYRPHELWRNYINGVQVHIGTFNGRPTPLCNGTHKLIIGADLFRHDPLSAQLWDIRIYNRAWTAEQIREYHQGPPEPRVITVRPGERVIIEGGS